MIKTIPVIATIAIAAILIGSVFGTTMTSTTAEAHVVSDDDLQSFTLCAIEIDGGQNVIPQGNDIASVLHPAATFEAGLVYEDSWTFAIPDSVTEDNDCIFSTAPTVPGPAIELNRGEAYEITLVNDKDNEHVHSIDMHALVGDEHVNSGPIVPGESKTWAFAAENVGTFLYHCGANNLNNVWTHIANGMYGSFVVNDGDDNSPVAYSVQFADMYIDSTGNSFDFGAFMDEDNTLEVTNGQAFNYAPFIGSDIDEDHKTLQLNPLLLVTDEDDQTTLFSHADGDLGGVPILAPVGETTRWHINNPGPNQFLAFHFIAGQMDIRDGAEKDDLMTVELNEETWTVPPGSASTFDVVFPSPGLYLGVTHKLSDVVKGGAFAVVACDVDNPENNANDARGLASLLCDGILEVDVLGGNLPEIDSLELMALVNSIANPKVIVQHIVAEDNDDDD